MDVAAYPPAVRALLNADRIPELGPGHPNAAARPALAAMTMASLFGPAKIRHPDLAQACLAGLWLHHDYLDESHAISQDLAGVEGSYWHGILHRREPDYGNAAYWFRRVGTHPIFAPLGRRAAELAGLAGAPAGSAFLTRQTAWDPFAFIDLCQTMAKRQPQGEALCRQVQRAEWELLFAYCYEHAV